MLLQHFFQAFRRDARGSVFVMAALTALGVVGAVGLAVDAGRAQMAQNKLQNAIDAAGLAAGASLNSADLEAVVAKYIALNFASGNLGATLGEVDVTLSDDSQILTATATATLPTTFMTMFGKDSVTLHAETEVTRTNKGMELALVLDVTGSMCQPCSKIDTLKSSAHDLVDILFGDNADSENLWVGIVPFSQAVNIGTEHTDWLDSTHFAGLDWGTTSWAGCVEARWQHGNDITDAPPNPGTLPDSEKFKAYYWPDHNSYNNWITTSSSSSSSYVCHNRSSCTCSNYACGCTTQGDQQTCISCSGWGSGRDCTQTVTTTTTNYSITSTKGPNTYCPVPVTRLTNVKATVDAGIDALSTGGATHVNVGAVWGWRMLSPNWRGLWGGSMNSNSLPLDYGTDLMLKAAVIMTDGENTMYDYDDTAYGYLFEGQLGTTQVNDAQEALDNRLTSVCNAMKAQGILVYTIVFDLNDGNVETLLRNCATTPDYYFEADNEAALRSAFHTIGDSLANLRISR